jgi:hypothetical protein
MFSFESGNATSEFTARDEHVDVVGAFVSVDGFHVHEGFDNVVLEENSVTTTGFSGKGDYFSSETRSHTFSSSDLTHTGLTFVEIERKFNKIGDLELTNS